MINPYRLYLVTDRPSLKNNNLADVVEAAVSAGVSCVQLREKDCSTQEFIELGFALKERLAAHRVPLFINDRIDVAIAVNADGVHLGNSDMSYSDARRILGGEKEIGLTINHPAQITQYNSYQLAYLGVSAVFHSTVKKDIERIWTASEISALKSKSKHLLIGIGGITPANTQQLVTNGLDGIAVASAICAQPSLEAVKYQTQKFIRELI